MYLITNARILDGTGREPFGGAVRVEGNRIAAVTTGVAPAADGATVIDAAGATLMPGLVESHAHAAGVFYGGNIMKPWGDGPAPFDLTPQIACPMIGFFGLDDTNPSPADVDRIDAELTRHGKTHEFHRYAGTGHAFLNFMNSERYRPGQAKEAWQKMLDFLGRTLKR